ncbi:reverse transcriptase domain-containing protein [Tanacetum coccineum]
MCSSSISTITHTTTYPNIYNLHLPPIPSHNHHLFTTPTNTTLVHHTPPPPPETEPTIDEYLYEEHSPVHHHFSPSQEQEPILTDSEDEVPEVARRKSQADLKIFIPRNGYTSSTKGTCFRSIDKGRRYKRRKETKGKKVVSSLDFQEDDAGAEKIKYAWTKRRGKALCSVKKLPKKQEETNFTRRSSLADSNKIGSLQKEEEAEQIHLDALLAPKDCRRRRVESFSPISFEATKDSLKRFGEELQTKTPKRLKEEKGDEAKDDESTKKSGKRRKQMARKGINTNVDENDSEESDKVDEQEETNSDDLTELYRIVMSRYGMDGPKDKLENGFWKCLRIMFEEPLSTDSIWSKIGQQKIISWRYYDTCREVQDNPLKPKVKLKVFKDRRNVLKELEQIKNIIPHIVTQVTDNTCNPKEFDGKGGAVALTSWIEMMESVFDNSGCTANQRVRYAASCFVNKALTWWNTQVQARGREVAIGMSWNDFNALLVEEFCPSNEMGKLILAYQESAILTAGILTDEVVHYGTLTKGNNKRKETEESSKKWSTWKDNKKSKTGLGFVVTVPPRNDNVSTYPQCAKCYTFYPENAPCKLCYNCQKPGHYARQCWAPIRQVVPVNAVRMGQNQRACYECGSLDHFRNDCPKWKQATGQARNLLTLEGNRNTQNNGNQARGRAFNGNAVEALQDPKVLTGTFSLNNQFATVLFDYGADFSFISTKFTPLLNVEPCIVNPGYVIEIADGENVEVDRIIRDCKPELGNSLFTIDLIPLGHGSFDVIVGMDWLSKNKAVIMCHEKVVEIPIKLGGIL